MRPWLRSLEDLRPLFLSRMHDDLRCPVVVREIPREIVQLAAGQRGGFDPAPLLPLPEGEIGGRKIIRDQITSRLREKGTVTALYRHIWIGKADARSVADFEDWADDAGMCVAARPTSSMYTGDRYSWIEYVCEIATQRVPGTPLRARILLSDVTELAVGEQARYVVLPVSIFRASVQAIDTIIEHAPRLFGAGAIPDGSTGAPKQNGSATASANSSPTVQAEKRTDSPDERQPNRSAGRPRGKPSDNEERDEWLYDEYVKGAKLKTILNLLKAKFPLASYDYPSAITNAVHRAAVRWGIPKPVHGQGVNHRRTRSA